LEKFNLFSWYWNTDSGYILLETSTKQTKMKFFKNYSVIFGLAFTLIFFSACGKKENADEIKLPFETKQIAKPAVKKHSPIKSSRLPKLKNDDTRPVLIKVFEKGQRAVNAIVKIKKPTRKLSWWTAETDEDGNAEISVPVKWKYFSVIAQKDNYALATFYTNNLTPGNSPISVELNLDEEGIIITAELISNKKIDEDNENVFAKITSDLYKDRQNLFAARSTVCENNKIIFPPIKSGLKRMKILVIFGDFAKSYSDYFDTLDGTNKTIHVNLLEGVKLYGRAVRADGTPITNVYFRATPRGLYEKSQIGHIHAKMKPDEEGNFEVFGLVEGHNKLLLTADYGDDLSSNVVLYSDEENRYVFTFPTNNYRTIKGIVKYEKTDEPAEGIKIKFVLYKRKREERIITTDENGKFEIKLPVYRTTLEIKEPGYAQIRLYLSINNKDNKLIELYLKETGIITGKITDEDDNPISGVNAYFMPYSRERYGETKNGYNAKTQFASNEEGIYVVSNAAAPETYCLAQTYGNPKYILPRENRKVKIKTNPGEVTIFNFIMKAAPEVKIKLIDENGIPVTRYELKYNVSYESGGSRGSDHVNLRNQEDWYNLQMWDVNKEMKLSLTAQTLDNKIAVTNDIEIISGKKSEIILKINPERKADVAGFVYNYDMTPVVDKYIYAHAGEKKDNIETDYLGYFEIAGLGVKKGSPLLLLIWNNDISYSTNVLAGSEDIEWILPKPKQITGKVFIENLDTPASKFYVSVGEHNDKKIHSDDGSFSTVFNADNSYYKRTFKVFVSADGYAAEEREINPSDINSFNLGDIILINKAATVSGKVVDKNNEPVRVSLTLMKMQMGRSYGGTESKASDGTYEFKNISPGEYAVMAFNELNNVRSEPFEVTAGENFIVPNLEVLTPDTADSISGTVTLDDVPLDNEKILFFSENKMIQNEIKVTNGKFETKVLPGKYVVSCIKRKVAAVVDLRSSNDNSINFKSGNSSFALEMPFNDNWLITLIRKFGDIKAPVASLPLKNKKNETISNIQAGEYMLYAFCWSKDSRTNITVETTINAGETKKIKF